MSVVFRVRAWPRIAATGAVVAVFLAGGNNDAPHYDGQHYMAGIIADPRFETSVSFGDDGWAARAVPQSGAIGWMPAEPERLDALQTYYWRDATIEIDRIKDGVTTRRLTGNIAEASISEGRLVITCADLSNRLDKPLAPATFAGTGGIEGGDFAIGRTKRLSFGRVWNVEGRLLDKANNIYEFGDPSVPLLDCTALRDKGRAGPLGILPWQGSIAATFAALQASAPVQGGGVFAPSIACAKWWTQPVLLTADLKGKAADYSETVAGVAAQLLAMVDGPSISNLAAAQALRPAAAGLHIGDANETAAAALDRLFQRVTLIWVLTATGQIEVRPWTLTAPIETLNAVFISRERTIQPVKSRQVGYKKNERQHGDGEISIALQADDVVYADGTTAEELKPAEPGATHGATPEQVSQLSQLATDLAAAETLVSSIQAQVDGGFASLQAQVTDVQGDISALETSVQADINALETEIAGINPMATPNLLVGGDFEDGLNGWTQTGSWTAAPANPRWGNHVLGPTANGSYALEKLLPVGLVGTTYTLSADIRALATSGNVRLVLEWRNSSSTLLSATNGPLVPMGSEFDVTGAVRKTYKVTGTVPTNATQVSIKASFASMTGISANGLALRRIKFEMGDKATSFTTEASSYTAYQTGVSNTGSLATLSSTVSTLNGTVTSQATSISSLTSGLSTLQNLATASSNPNLLKNGSFENRLQGWTQLGPGAGSWNYLTWAWGTYASIGLSYTAPSNQWVALQTTDYIDLAGDGNVYTMSGEVDLPTSGTSSSVFAYMEIAWYNASNSLLGQSQGPGKPRGTGFTNDGSQRATHKFTAASPSGAVKAKVSLVAFVPSGASIASISWRQIKLEFGSIATPYSGEATASQMFTAYSDLNSSFASLSSTVSSQGSSISSLQTAMTTANGNIATLTNTLNASSNPNLMDNGGFENGLTGWVSNVGGWNIANNGTWGTYAYRQGDFTGTAYMYKDVTGIAAGWPYTITCDPNVSMSSGSYSLSWQIQWLNASNSLISAIDGPALTGGGLGFSPSGANRAAIKTTGTAPAGTTWARLVLYFNKLSGTMIEIDMRQVKLEIGTVATPFSPEATIKSVYTVANTNSSSIASINSTLSTTNANVSSLQSAMSTAQGDVATLKAKVSTGGGNLVKNSAFINSSTAGWWVGGTGATTSYGVDGGGDSWRPTGEHVLHIYVGAAQANTGYVEWSTTVPAEPGKTYESSAYCGLHGGAAGNMYLIFRDASGNWLSATSGGIGAGPANGGRYLSGYSRPYVKSTAPSGTVDILLLIRKESVASGDSWIFIARPQIREVDANFAGPAPYEPSSNQASVETISQSVNGVLAKYGVTLDVNGYVTGFQQLNNGSSGSFIINADYFAVGKPGASTFYPFEVVGGVTRIKSAAIGDATIDTLKIANGAVTNITYASGTNTMTTGYATVASVTMTPASGTSVLKIDIAGVFQTGLGASGGTQYGYIRVRRGTDVIVPEFKAATGQGMAANFSYFAILTGITGAQTFTVEGRNQLVTPSPPTGEPSTVLATIAVTEFKK